MNDYMKAALKLYDNISENHWNGRFLLGPDPGLRYNVRVWRFLKSYLRFLPWKDTHYFLQCQGYWIWDNWKLYDLFQESKYEETARACTEFILECQKMGGYWEYPLKRWKGRVATVEGCYAALGLIESYRHTGEKSLLNGLLAWYDFLIEKVGFQEYKDSLAVNYFAGRSGRLVPNNATLVLELFGYLFDITKQNKYLTYCKEMIKFLKYSQTDTGELPYAFMTPDVEGREHFLCYQYNCFQFLDLAHYWEMTKDDKVRAILKKLIAFISTGLHEKDHSKYNCAKSYPEVTYYTAVMGAAFLKATEIGLGDYSEYENRAYMHLLARQNRKGGFIHSSRNYGILSDRRSYPRYLVMILKHLLLKAEKGG